MFESTCSPDCKDLFHLFSPIGSLSLFYTELLYNVILDSDTEYIKQSLSLLFGDIALRSLPLQVILVIEDDSWPQLPAK